MATARPLRKSGSAMMSLLLWPKAPSASHPQPSSAPSTANERRRYANQITPNIYREQTMIGVRQIMFPKTNRMNIRNANGKIHNEFPMDQNRIRECKYTNGIRKSRSLLIKDIQLIRKLVSALLLFQNFEAKCTRFQFFFLHCGVSC